MLQRLPQDVPQQPLQKFSCHFLFSLPPLLWHDEGTFVTLWGCEMQFDVPDDQSFSMDLGVYYQDNWNGPASYFFWHIAWPKWLCCKVQRLHIWFATYQRWHVNLNTGIVVTIMPVARLVVLSFGTCEVETVPEGQDRCWQTVMEQLTCVDSEINLVITDTYSWRAVSCSSDAVSCTAVWDQLQCLTLVDCNLRQISVLIIIQQRHNHYSAADVADAYY